MNKKNHPTAEVIFNDLNKKVPSLSKATVYNTMEHFHKNNIVQVLTFKDGVRHYDAETKTHIHFNCIKCGIIYDFHTKIDFDNINGINDFEINKQFINFEGICKKCKAVYPADYKNDTCEAILKNGETCDGELITRSDDNPEAIQTRLDAFEQETVPAINVYQDQLIKIDGEPTIDEVVILGFKALDPIML